MTRPAALLLVASDSAAAAARRALARTVGVESPAVAVSIVDGPIPGAVALARATAEGPVALLAATDADTIEAIAAGADEALAVAPDDARSVELLVERASARFALRQADARERLTAAHAEKLVAIGTLVAGVAHEINNPLAAVMLSVEALSLGISPLVSVLDELRRVAVRGGALSADEVARLVTAISQGAPSSEIREMLADTSAQVRTIADIVRDLRIYARIDDDEKPSVVHVPDLIDQVLRMVGRQIEMHGHVERDYAPDAPPLAIPRSRIVQVVTNILVNAAHAITEIERPVHRVRISVRADADYVAMSFSDTGPGIPAESFERIFDPFFTTKKVGAGTGLGLSISRAILRKLGGDLLVESVHGTGATFIALVPRPDAASLREASRSALVGGPRRATRRVSVLIVDDDERVLRTYPRVLRDRYDVILATDGREAIDLLASGSPAEAIVTDLAMPEVDGRAFYSWLTENRPDLARRTVFVTGGARDPEHAEFLARLPNRVLEKPTGRAALVEAIETALEPSNKRGE